MNYLFPIPPGYSDLPNWTGQGFQIGLTKVSVLLYTHCDAGWDAGLTDFHEQEADAGNHYIDRASRLHAFRTLERYVPNSNAVVLEIGSSSGYLLKEIKQYRPDLFLIGSDCIPEPLENIARIHPDIPLIQFDLNSCPLPESSIDVVVALNVLEHIEDHETAIQQIYRILKPGGYVILEVPSNPDLFDFYDKQLKHFRRYNIGTLCNIAHEENFIIVRASHLGFFLYPAFWFMKFRNKRQTIENITETKRTVKNQIQFGGPIGNIILYTIMIFELFLGQMVSYPCGIRCLLVLKKPI